MTGTIEQAIGRGVSRIRADYGLTQDQLAQRARALGVKWSTARVRELERGELRVTVAVLAVLLTALAELTGEQFAPADLLDSDDVEVTPTWTVPGPALQALFAGEGVKPSALVAPGEMRSVAEKTATMRRYIEDLRASEWRYPPKLTLPLMQSVIERPTTLAEQRAARRLGIDAGALKAWALFLWGRSLDEQAAATAGDSQQARGHATRKLVSDIREAIEKEYGRG